MIHLSTGLPRNGKTLFTIQYVKDLAERENRQVFYSGISAVTLPWTEIDAEKWYECPQSAIILIDEAQRLFRPRGNGSQVPRYVSELETHGHEGHDIFIITQHPMLIDTNVRRLTERHWHISRPDGADKATVLSFKGVKEQPVTKAAIEDAERMEWSYPKELYGCYESAKAHTVRKRFNVQRAVMWGAPAVVIALMGWFTWRHFGPADQPKAPAEVVATTQVSSGEIKTGNAGSKEKSKTLTREEYLDALKPRIDGLAYTAPRYDEITKPVRVAVPVGTVVSKRGGCRAYSQQGTPLDMSQELCLSINKNGFFREFDDRVQGVKTEQAKKEKNDKVLIEEPPVT